MTAGSRPFGYTEATDTHEDLVKAGVIDPTKIVRSALRNAGFSGTHYSAGAARPRRSEPASPETPG